MTYCIGLYLEDGLVMLADTRTNAGMDNIATYSKTYTWEVPGERILTLMAAGNLSITQSVVNMLNEGIPPLNDPEGSRDTMLNVNSLFQASRLVGRAIRQIHQEDAEAMQAQDTAFHASFLLGGQLKGREMRLFNIYSAGNFINATPETPFLQIGEHKYGKPILDRAFSYSSTSIMDGIKLALLSMDSTIRSNMSVGFPLDLIVYRKNQFKLDLKTRIEDNDPYFQHLSKSWSDALCQSYQQLPSPDWK